MSLPTVPTTVLSFARWPVQGREAAWLAELDLPHLRQWLVHAQNEPWPVWPKWPHADAALTPPHEQAWARLSGWPEADGGLSTAAQAAVESGLTAAGQTKGWAFVTLCHWQVSNGQVTLGDPAHLRLTAEEDQALLAAMQGFFAEDGLMLYPYQTGEWLVQADWLADVPTASLDRVIGQDVNAWLVGCESPQLSTAAKTLRRLQNEMQMLLYTHAVNAQRALSVNSFWVHGTGQAAVLTPSSHVQMVHTLRAAAQQQNGQAWLDAWREVDAQVLPALLQAAANGQPQRLVLCGEHTVQSYVCHRPSWWQRWHARLKPVSVAAALSEPQF